MRLLRPFVCAAALVAASAFGVQPAFAAAPPNDTIEGATAASLGFSEVIDTTEATTDADDAQLNETCGAPATDASVWYTITLAADSGVVVDVSASDYPAGVLVGVGSPGALETVACGLVRSGSWPRQARPTTSWPSTTRATGLATAAP